MTYTVNTEVDVNMYVWMGKKDMDKFQQFQMLRTQILWSCVNCWSCNIHCEPSKTCTDAEVQIGEFVGASWPKKGSTTVKGNQ